MNELYCEKKCCKLKYTTFVPNLNINYSFKNNKKSGIMYIVEDKILIIQSRGNLWGIPKGSLEENETYILAAVREFKEETGIHIQKDDLNDYIRIDNCIYYIVFSKNLIVPDIDIYDKVHDATGIGLININCLPTLKIKFTTHFKILLKLKFNIIV